MPYEVRWSSYAEKELDQPTLSASQKQALSDATARVEAALAMAPRDVGTMRLVSTRILVDKPLGIVYDIIEDDKIVVIAEAWIIK
jgi:mRNA-degrading endonuclease RelE of RelBE toxin-antitoxin system